MSFFARLFGAFRSSDEDAPYDRPFVFRFEPKPDMTAFELLTIMRHSEDRLFASYQVRPEDLRKVHESLGSAWRHFRLDEDVEDRIHLESKIGDLIGQPLSMDLLDEVAKRTEAA